MSRIPPGVRVSVEASRAAEYHWLGSGNFAHVSVVGRRQDFSAVFGTVWPGQDIPYPDAQQPGSGGTMPEYAGDATAQTLYLSTDNAADTSNVVVVEGLDANGAFQTASAQVNGTNGVALAGTWCRVNRAWISDGPGLTTSFAREIYVGTNAAPPLGVPAGWEEWAVIEGITGRTPNNWPSNQTEQAHYTVPLGWNAHVVGLQAGCFANGNPSGAIEAGLQLQTKQKPGPWRTREYINVRPTGATQATNVFPGGIEVPELADIRIIGVGDNLPIVYARFDLFLRAIS